MAEVWRGATSLLSATFVLGVVTGCGFAPASGADSIQRHAEAATAEQRRFFADGVIDFDDYEEAVFATVACVASRGYKASAELAEDGLYQFIVEANTDADAVPMGVALDRCRARWSASVQGAYMDSVGPAPEDAPAVSATILCLQDAGEPPSLGSRPDQLRDFIGQLPDESPARACANLLPSP